MPVLWLCSHDPPPGLGSFRVEILLGSHGRKENLPAAVRRAPLNSSPLPGKDDEALRRAGQWGVGCSPSVNRVGLRLWCCTSPVELSFSGVTWQCAWSSDVLLRTSKKEYPVGITWIKGSYAHGILLYLSTWQFVFAKRLAWSPSFPVVMCFFLKFLSTKNFLKKFNCA